MKNELDIIIPISIEQDWPTKEDIVRAISEQHIRYGFKSFMLAAPSAGWRSLGYPSEDVFRNLANLFCEVKKELSGKDITLGWWNTLTIKSGGSDQIQCIVKEDGTGHPFANCPLDENFKRTFAQNIALFAEIAKPSMIIFEDDFSVTAAAGRYGCFCPLHLKEFSNREGKTYKREALQKAFEKRDPESIALQKRFRKLMGDSLVDLSEAVRAELDKKSPEINIGLMQSGSLDTDGDATELVARALAGKDHTPFCRIHGSYYCGGEAFGIPEKIYHAVYSSEHLTDHFDCYYESDTYPHTRFFTSAKQMKAFMAIAYSSGVMGSTFQTQQLLDDPNEETAHAQMFADERARFNELYRTVKECERVGVSLPYDPFYNTLDSAPGEEDPYWCRALNLFGIPYTTKETETVFLDERLLKYATEEEIMRYLSGTLFLDGDAALALCKRGYGSYLGVNVGEDVAKTGNVRYDLGARDIIKAPFNKLGKGKHMPSTHMYAPVGNGILRELTITDPKTEVISEEYTCDQSLLSPSMTRFRNSLGGRVIVMGMTLKGNRSHSLFNYRRKRLFEEMLIWSHADVAFVKNEPCVHMIVNQNTRNNDFSYLVTMINLGADTIQNISLYLPNELRGRKILSLSSSALWEEAKTEPTECGVTVLHPLACCEPMYLKFI